MESTVIDSGRVKFIKDKELPEIFSGKTFVYRRFSWQPIDKAFLFYLPSDKPDWICEMEMDVMLDNKKPIQVIYPAINNINGTESQLDMTFAVHWNEDGLPDIAFSDVDIFGAMLSGDADIEEVDEEYFDLHMMQIELYAKILTKTIKEL